MKGMLSFYKSYCKPIIYYIEDQLNAAESYTYQ